MSCSVITNHFLVYKHNISYHLTVPTLLPIFQVSPPSSSYHQIHLDAVGLQWALILKVRRPTYFPYKEINVSPINSILLLYFSHYRYYRYFGGIIYCRPSLTRTYIFHYICTQLLG